MKAFAETEKAVQLEMLINFEVSEKTRTTRVWFPKSQINNGKVSEWIWSKKVDEVDAIFRANQFCTHELRDADGAPVAIELTAATKKAQKDFYRSMKIFHI